MATEKRLIDANALSNKMFYVEEKTGGHGWVIALEDVSKAPTVDAVEVVRCKDCRHWIERTANGIDTFHICWFNGSITERKHFCPYGERKKDA